MTMFIVIMLFLGIMIGVNDMTAGAILYATSGLYAIAYAIESHKS